MKKYIGVDIGGTSVKIALVNDNGKIIEKIEKPVAFDGYETPIIRTVIYELHNLIEDFTVYEGIGVSATGQIDSFKGTVVGTNGKIKNYVGSNFQKEFSKEFNLPVRVINDANAMILGEKWIGRAKNRENVIGITIGTGIGGGILVDNSILLGHKGLAGEIGQLNCDINRVGKKGYFENLGATTALVKRVKEELNLEEEIDGHYIFNEANKGNTEILNILNDWINVLAGGLISLIHIFNPELVLIGGGVSAQEQLLIKPLREKIFKGVLPRFADDLTIKKADLLNEAGLIGAVYFLKNQLGN